MKVHFLEPAQAEMQEAISYYEAERNGLGAEFAEEVKKTIERIVQYPEAWSLLSQRTRRCLTNKFPYGLIYQIRGEDILIIAVMNLYRDPKTWRSRVRQP